MTAILAALLLPAALALPQEPAEAPGTAPVYIVPIRGELDSTMLSLVRRGMAAASESGAAAVVFEIDTPGGAVDLMWQIARMIGPPGPGRPKGGVPTVAFIANHAWSAGALIALSCGKIVAMEGASIGAAMPVQPGPTGILPLPAEVRPKIMSALRAEFRAWAEAGGRNPLLAEAMVDPDVELVEAEVEGERRILSQLEVDDLRARRTAVRVLKTLCAKGEILSLTAREALRLEFIDNVVADREDLLRVLGASGAPVVEMRATWAENFVKFLKVLWPFLFIAGCVLAYVEMKIPGFGAPGILALVSFGLVLFGNYLAGLATYADILFVLVGFALIAVELFLLPGSLVFGILGALSVAGGLVLSFQNVTVPEYGMDWVVLQGTAWTLALSLGGVAVLIFLLARYLPSVPLLRRLVLLPPAPRTGEAALVESPARNLVGSAGVAVTDLRPAGKVEVAGKLLDAQTSGGFVERGARIRVLEVGGNRVVVEGIA